jgi:deoxycytidylate deaminase
MATATAPAANEPLKAVDGGLFGAKPTRDILSSTNTQEIVLALCGPMGSPLHEVADKLREMLLGTFGYESCKVLRLSGFIEAQAVKAQKPIRTKPAERRHDLINLGDEMRNEYGHSVLAELAVNDIRLDRELHGKDPETGRFRSRRICHIVDSIKNRQELELLRTVYREALYVVGVFAPSGQRESELRKQGMDGPEIAVLMDRDSGEEIDGGQTVGDTFPLSDFFLRMDSNTETELRGRVERFLHLILGTSVITPTRAEMAMYAAASAAGNSACLSRQVGAAVTDVDGKLLAIGWNDVPKAFGDLYVTDLADDPSSHRDNRCWNHGGKCYNDEEKMLLAEHIIDALGDLLPSEKRMQAVDAVVRDRKLRNLIEFSRSIHAEMHALLSALRQEGDRVHGGTMYVTTYPCHSCARHIIAAGISKVIFIEPYKKSLAVKLHGDAMTELEQDLDKVRLLPYDGVAPGRYLGLFRMKPDSRKLDGKVVRVAPDKASPRLEKSLEAFPTLEGLVIASLKDKGLVDN